MFPPKNRTSRCPFSCFPKSLRPLAPLPSGSYSPTKAFEELPAVEKEQMWDGSWWYVICVTFWTLVALAIHHYNALLNQKTFSSKTSSATTPKLRTRPFIIFQISQISIVLMVGQCFVARCSAVLSVETFADSQTSLLQTGHNGLKMLL